MEIRTVLTHSELSDERLASDIAVVIDVLRATTTLLSALMAEPAAIAPVKTVAEAFELKESLSNERVLLCGERSGKLIPGFDMGNSPSEYKREKVVEATIIYASTNGSIAMKKARQLCDRVLLASFNNLSAVVDAVIHLSPKRLLLVCSGKEGHPSLEDTACGGEFIRRLAEKVNIDPEDDTTEMAVALVSKIGNPAGTVFYSEHGRYLASLGFENDLETASRLDITELVPELAGDKIIPSKE